MRPDYQRGQIYPLIAFMLFSIVALSALAVDMGYYRYAQRHQQTATDSAAIAAATQAVYPSPNAQNAAYVDAQKNGFATSDPSVTVVAAPASDNYTGAFTAYKVTITKNYPKFFSGYFGGGKQGIKTTAVGRLAAIPNTCILGTSTTQQSNMQNDDFEGPNCGIIENSCPNANKAVIDAASVIVPTGCSPGGAFTGAAPVQVAVPAPDPCLYISGCNYLNQTYTPDTTGCLAYKAASKTETKALLTGSCYNSVSINSGESIVLEPPGPPYVIIFNGGINFNTPSSVTTGANGATIYITSSGSLSMSGVTTVTLSAPTTGSSAGMLVYEVGGSATTLNFNNSNTAATWTLDGIVYAPSVGNINLNGNINFGATTLVIAPVINLNCPGGKGPCVTKLNPAGGLTSDPTAPTLAE